MKRLSLFLIVAMMISTSSVVADDFAPPDYRGQPLSYFAEWEFLNSGTIGGNPPDNESSVGSTGGEFLYSQFQTHIDVDGPDWTWDLADGDGGMVNPVRDARFGINAVNWVDEEPEKYIRVQLTYIGAPPTVISATGFEYDLYHGGGMSTTELGIFQAGPAVNVDPIHLYSDIVMVPNPDFEIIEVFVPQGTIIDEIVIDTISIPEPSVLILFSAMGGAILFVRRRLML